VTPADREEVLAKGIDRALLPTQPPSEIVAAVLELARERHSAAGRTAGLRET
jgi:hypothetical protein